MKEKKVVFYETDLISLIKRVAREEIATAPTFQTFLKSGNSSEIKSTLNAYPDMTLGSSGLSSGRSH